MNDEFTEKLRTEYPILTAYEIDGKTLQVIADETGCTKGQIAYRLAKERGALIRLTSQTPAEIASWHGTAKGVIIHHCDCLECVDAYEVAQEQQKETKKEKDRARHKDNVNDREAGWQRYGIIGLCSKSMSKGKTCGKSYGHTGQHSSVEALQKVGSNQKAWKKTDKGKESKRNDRWRWRGVRGMTVELYDYMLHKQDNRCALCGRHASEFTKRLHVDHDHSITARFNVRGLLCTRCNVGMGFIDAGWALPSPAITAYLAAFAAMDLAA